MPAALSSRASASTPNGDTHQFSRGIRAGDLSEHTRILASDAFGGRPPSGPAADKVVDYLTGQFSRLGLSPTEILKASGNDLASLKQAAGLGLDGRGPGCEADAPDRAGARQRDRLAGMVRGQPVHGDPRRKRCRARPLTGAQQSGKNR